MGELARPDDPVLVAIMNNRLDLATARDAGWYRIPMASARKWLAGHWPPRWLAFYQTKTFGAEAFAIRYFARVTGIRQVARWELFPAERQEFVTVGGQNYALDFAVYCARGKIDIETDGDRYRIGPEEAPRDNLRNNALGAAGWTVLRFTTHQINEQLADYCLPTIVGNLNALGGVDEGKAAGRRVSDDPEAPAQPALFDD